MSIHEMEFTSETKLLIRFSPWGHVDHSRQSIYSILAQLLIYPTAR